MKIFIPPYAKKRAEEALSVRERLPRYLRYGIEKEQAAQTGITSGVERAKQLMKSKYLNENDAKRVAAFYNRFKGRKSFKVEGALNLWGGRKFGEYVVKKLEGGQNERRPNNKKDTW